MNKFLVLLIALLIPVVGLSEVYKWVDEKGKVHFSDKKPDSEKANAETVDVGVNVVESQVKYQKFSTERETPVREKPERKPLVIPLSNREKKKIQE